MTKNKRGNTICKRCSIIVGKNDEYCQRCKSELDDRWKNVYTGSEEKSMSCSVYRYLDKRKKYSYDGIYKFSPKSLFSKDCRGLLNCSGELIYWTK